MEDVKKRLEFANPFVQHQVCILSASCFYQEYGGYLVLIILRVVRIIDMGLWHRPLGLACLIGRATWDLRCAQHEGGTGTDECVQMLTEGMEKRSFTRLG